MTQGKRNLCHCSLRLALPKARLVRGWRAWYVPSNYSIIATEKLLCDLCKPPAILAYMKLRYWFSSHYTRIPSFLKRLPIVWERTRNYTRLASFENRLRPCRLGRKRWSVDEGAARRMHVGQDAAGTTLHRQHTCDEATTVVASRPSIGEQRACDKGDRTRGRAGAGIN